MTEITYHLQPKRKQITVLVFDLEILTRLDKNLLNRGMMRKVDSGKQMMNRVKVQPKINCAVQERRIHSPICTDMQLSFTPIQSFVSRTHVQRVLGIVIH